MSHDIPVSGDQSAPVPVYNCHVFIKKSEGKYQARFANIEIATITAGNERAALSQAVANFKSHIVECASAGNPVQWLNPPLDKEDDEVERLIPVHL